MPLTNSATSYPPTMQEFIAHWTAMNAARDSDFVLPNGYSVGALTGTRAVLLDFIAQVTAADAGVETASATYKVARATARDALQSLRRAVGFYFGASIYPPLLPLMPGNSVKDAELFAALHKAGDIWARINADTSLGAANRPLILPDGTTQAAFVTLVNGAQTQQAAVEMADNAAQGMRANRDLILPTIRANLVAYRKGVMALYPPNSVEVMTLPAISAPNSGPTPNAPTGTTALFNATTRRTLVTWDAPDVAPARYSVRSCAGPKWKADDARVVGDVNAAVHEWLSDVDFPSVGATENIKVVALSEAGREAASRAVKVTRAA